MRRGKRNRWDYDQSPQGEGICVLHDDMGRRIEIHDIAEQRAINRAKTLGISAKSAKELLEYGIIK
jgi:hypothetical protein